MRQYLIRMELAEEPKKGDVISGVALGVEAVATTDDDYTAVARAERIQER